MLRKKRKRLVLIILGILSSTTLLMAQETTPTLVSKKPIICKWPFLGGMQYYLGGKRLEGKDFEQTVFSLKDAEATKLLNDSKNSETLGWIGIGCGVPLMVAGIIGMNNSSNSNSVNPVWAVVGLGGTAIGVTGSVFLVQSNLSKFAAVQRYDQVIYGDTTDLSFDRYQRTRGPMLLSWDFKF